MSHADMMELGKQLDQALAERDAAREELARTTILGEQAITAEREAGEANRIALQHVKWILAYPDKLSPIETVELIDEVVFPLDLEPLRPARAALAGDAPRHVPGDGKLRSLSHDHTQV